MAVIVEKQKEFYFRQTKGKEDTLRITEGISLPRLTEVSTDQVRGYPLPSASTTLSLGNSVLGGWGRRDERSECGTLLPANSSLLPGRTHIPTHNLLS